MMERRAAILFRIGDDGSGWDVKIWCTIFILTRNHPLCYETTVSEKSTCLVIAKYNVKQVDGSSLAVTCTTGVPQGSVLGSLLFTVYISSIAVDVDVRRQKTFTAACSLFVTRQTLTRAVFTVLVTRSPSPSTCHRKTKLSCLSAQNRHCSTRV